jgi:hypothetical protein
LTVEAINIATYAIWENAWRVHQDGHKLNGWNVLGPDLPANLSTSVVLSAKCDWYRIFALARSDKTVLDYWYC